MSPTHRAFLVVIALSASMFGINVGESRAQTDPTYDASGVKYGRGYFAPSSFEQIDTVTGNLVMSFADLSLPGNAGFSLTIIRTYNSRDGRWRFGIAGVPMSFKFNLPNSDLSDVDFVMADGSTQNASGVGSETMTLGYWRFHPATHRLELPNGLTAIFDYVVPGEGGFLTEIRDPFDNTIVITWEIENRKLLAITQNLGNGQSIPVNFTNWVAGDVPNSMSCNGVTWSYEWEVATIGSTNFKSLKTVTPPVAALWRYAYQVDGAGGLKLATITTPHGGQISYTWATQTFPTTPTNRMVVHSRATGGNVPAGTWMFAWQNNASTAVVTGPVNRIVYETTDHAGGPMTSVRKLETLGGSLLETETVTFEDAPHPLGVIPLIKTRTLVGAGATYSTTYTYSQDNFADYGNPVSIAEAGQLSRTTSLTYKHDFIKYIRGRVLSATATVGGQSIGRSFQYDNQTGFVTAATALGLTTTFAADAQGNVATARNPLNHVTSFSYAWGSVASVATPEWTMTRTGQTAFDETVTRGDTVTTIHRNGLMAITSISTNTAGRLPITTTYDVSNGIMSSVTVTQGSGWVRADLDGFGRTIHTQDASGAETRNAFDAMGRVVSSSPPFGGGVTEATTAFTYDEFGRPDSVFTPGVTGAHQQFSYSATTVGSLELVAPGVSRTTLQTFAAFGDPADARLVSFRDALNGVWTYEYNAAGSVTAVHSSVAPSRSWGFDLARGNFLASSTQPESGTTLFDVDDGGNLRYSVDARGHEISGTTNTYDGNGRLRQIQAPGTDDDVVIAYDALDRVTTVERGAGATRTVTTLAYDTASRLTARTDVINGRTFSQTFTYDGMDRLMIHAYPSTGRVVTYAYDAASRVTSVKTQVGSGPEIVVASGFSYHPSGAVAGYTLGNGQTKSVTFDERQRPKHWVNGPLDITYAYDFAGNVTGITDARPLNTSTYGYDLLDRLTLVLGNGATSFSYDGAGNRLSAGTVSFHYDGQSRLASLSGSASGSFSYTANGSTTQDPSGATYAYSALNTMKAATLGANTTTYQYNGDGFRAVKTAAGTPATFYVRAGGASVIAEFRAVGDEVVVQREYIYGAGELLASVSTETGLPPIGISFLTPTTGQSFPSLQAFNLTSRVTAPAEATVLRVEYFLDGLLVGSSTDAANGYPVPWNNSAVALTTYRFRARVVLADGRAASSDLLSITIY